MAKVNDAIELVAGELYRVERLNYKGETGALGLIITKGDTVDIQVLGSKSKPTALADMVDIVQEQLVLETAYTMYMLTEYIYFVGTVTSIELEGYVAVEELGALA